MGEVTRFAGHDDLLRRQTIEVDLPRFLVRILEREVAKANEVSDDGDQVTLNNYIEFHLAHFVSIADVAELEGDVPGLGAAVWRWVEESNS